MSAYYVSKYTCEEIDALLDGKAVPIKGVYPSLDSLKAEFPNGADGLYQTSDTGNLYVWNAKKQEWESLGNIVGPAGPRGAAIVPSVSPDGVMSFREESGEVTLPEPVNVKGPQGVSVQSARIDESGDLILTLTDAQVINAGRAIGPEGAKGATGASIDRIERTEGTGAPGSIDTYTVHLTNGVTTTFQVYNGKDGDGAGDMIKAVYDPTGKEQDIFAYSVPQTRKINKKPLSADVTLTGEDIKVTGSDDTTIHTRLSELSNPNLLDNWYFVGGGSQQGGGQFPINQRGQISANTPGLLFFDRWKLHRYVSGTATLTVNGLDLVGDFDFGEIIESNRLPGTPNVLVTISVLLSDGTLKSKTSTLKNNGEYEFVVVAINPNTSFQFIRNWGKANLGLDSKKSNIDLAFFNLTNGDSVFPIAVKLELGSQQTLAHQENGKWVLNEIPDYGEQLRRCQRYFVRNDNAAALSGCAYAPNEFIINAPIPTMRSVPAISNVSCNGMITQSGKTIPASTLSFAVLRSGASGCVIKATSTQIADIGPAIAMDFSADSVADL